MISQLSAASTLLGLNKSSNVEGINSLRDASSTGAAPSPSNGPVITHI